MEKCMQRDSSLFLNTLGLETIKFFQKSIQILTSFQDLQDAFFFRFLQKSWPMLVVDTSIYLFTSKELFQEEDFGRNSIS